MYHKIQKEEYFGMHLYTFREILSNKKNYNVLGFQIFQICVTSLSDDILQNGLWNALEIFFSLNLVIGT